MEEFKRLLANLSAKLAVFWQRIRPYLITFRDWRRRIWKKYQLNKILLLLVLTVVLITSVYLFIVAKSVDIGSLKKGLEQVTVIYDKDGDEAGKLYGQKGTSVPLDNISPNIINAVLSTEDRRFYQHHGFDIRGIGRAFVGVLRSGHITGGGSTITQQLAKNAYLNLDQKISRKAKELFMAIEIEKTYTKDQILEMYLNNVYLGNGVWGMEDASHKYFGKSAAEVTVDEAAVLAGMLKGPSYYNPIDHMDHAIDRRDTVLSLMIDNGKLDQATGEQLMKEKLYLTDNYVDNKNSYQYPDYFDAVINEAENRYGIKADDILNKAFKIYTTMDQQYQQDMDATFSNDSLFPPNAADGVMVQGASVAINPQTGGVAAIVGGRGEHSYRGFNRATDGRISPGSTLKPISVYTPALEAGYKATDILKDEPLSFYQVKNYDGTYRGNVPMYTAVADSLNPPAVWLLNEIGIEKGVKKVEKFGISLEKEDHYPGLALGGLTKGTSPLKMASAYGVFANQGRQKEAHFIRKIVDANGAVLHDNETAKSRQVTSPRVAEEMTSMLRGVFSSGTGVAAQPYGYVMAGKTGTTESVNVDAQAKDQWIIGYTPDVVVATWIGFDKSSNIHYLTGTSGQGVSRIFKDETQRILAHSPGTTFEVADASMQENEKQQNAANVDQALKGFGQRLNEGVQEWGGKLKESGEKLKEEGNKLKNQLSDLFNQFGN